jgi:hypothetical protein
MKAELLIWRYGLGYDWQWKIISMHGTWRVDSFQSMYTSKGGAERAARRVARQFGIEIVKEGEA